MDLGFIDLDRFYVDLGKEICANVSLLLGQQQHFYGSMKEVTDTSKYKPFDNDALEEMALDPQLRRAA
ncbi:hypothetical protein K431DRAFT_308292 [Polychaeton citri CBS 116435]|uniref:Uncharacterized protein n=1 Tax=Polychaeton citri CBS 116435 TaxID=1314669 RepID=A0A9P4UHK2_9PEZI|nr:hypothetical protein K431DRAFT_308292 [Polychaeton citri CBS 116435]